MKQAITIFLLVTLAFLWVVDSARTAGLSSSVSENDLKEIHNVVLSQISKENAIKSVFYATSVLATIPKQAELVTLAKDILKSKSPKNVEEIYYAVGVVENLKSTDGVVVDKAVVDLIKSTVEDGDSITDFYYAGSAALSLRGLKLTKDIKEDDVTPLVSKLVDLADDDGTFRGSSADKEGSVFNAGLALQLLARFIKETKLSEEDKELIQESIVEKVESLISLGNEEDGTLEFTHPDDSVNSLASTSSVLRGVLAFAATQKTPLPEVTSAHITQIGQYLVNNKQVATLADAYYLVSGLRALQDNTIGVPLVVSLERASIVGTAKGAEGHVRVSVTDVFDKPVPVNKVYLVKAHPIGKDSHVLISNQDLTLDDDKKSYSINFLAAKPDQGFYSLEFRVVPAQDKYSPIESAIRTVKVVGSISITDLEVAVADSTEALSKASEGNRYRAADQTKKIDDTIRIEHFQFASVQFRVRSTGGTNKPVLVQQAFVKFTNVKTGLEATFVAQPNDNKVYSVVINVEEEAKDQFKFQSGEYKLEVVVGDSFIQNPVHWIVAKSVNLTFVAAEASSRFGSGPLPEIHHVFRVPEKRPPVFISTAFTFLVLSPLLFLFLGFILLGANISNFPFSGTEFLSAVGFIGSIGAILSLLALYWLRLNLVQTLGYLALLSLPTIFFGQRALSHIARRKEKAE